MKHIRKNKAVNSTFRNIDDLNSDQQAIMKKNIYEIYRMFSVDYSPKINREGLQALLSHLNMKVPEKGFDLYCRKLNLTEMNLLIDFEVWYERLLDDVDAENKKRSHWLSRLKLPTFTTSASKKVSTTNTKEQIAEAEALEQERQEEAENNDSLSYHLSKKMMYIEAKMVLVDCAVKTAQDAVRAEYRIVHPCKMCCEICSEAFPDAAQLYKHSKDTAYHRELFRKNIADEERFLSVIAIFTGEQGRRLSANRLIFNKELASLDSRIEAAIYEPHRPQLSDPTGKRYLQQLKGAFVQGFDPKCGIRPMYHQKGLMTQHLAPMRNKSAINSIIQKAHPTLQDVLNDLLRCRDHFIDTISTFDTHLESRMQIAEDSNVDLQEFLAVDKSKPPMYATVRIVFNGFADGQISIIGEFTGWKAEEMISDTANNSWYVVKQLCPGRYYYRFVIDGTECIDKVASWIPCDDPASSSEASGTPSEAATNTPPLAIEPTLRRGTISHTAAAVVTTTANLGKAHTLIPMSSGGGNRVNTSTVSVCVTGKQYTRSSAIGNNVLMVTNNAILHQHTVKSKHDKGTLVLPVVSEGMVSKRKKMLSSASQKALSTRSGDDETSSEGGLLTVPSRASTTNDSRLSTASPYYEGKIIHISKTDKLELIKRLQHINLRNTALYDDGTYVFATYIQTNSYIQSLDLSFNYISDEGITMLGCALPNLVSLTELKLNGNGFGIDGLTVLVQNMHSNHSLTDLELSGNRLGDDGMEVICTHLHYNDCIQNMFVDNCLIGNEGMECLHHALILNNTLVTISLAGNYIKAYGVNRLCKALEDNACLTHLNLNSNPLGPEGAKYLGDMLFVNNTLKTIELASSGIMATKSSYGIHGICLGLQRNHTLTTLNLKNNGMSSEHIVIEIADTLVQHNKTLMHIDLSGNNIANKKWFQRDMFIPTKNNKEMPSITTSLDRNTQHFKQHREARELNDLSRVKFAMDKVKRGRWTNRRVWRRVVLTNLDKIKSKQATALEHDRINAENQYITDKLAAHMTLMKLYLTEAPCKQYLNTLAKAITQYLYDLPKAAEQIAPPETGDRNNKNARQMSPAHFSKSLNGNAKNEVMGTNLRAESVKLRQNSAARPDSKEAQRLTGTTQSLLSTGIASAENDNKKHSQEKRSKMRLSSVKLLPPIVIDTSVADAEAAAQAAAAVRIPRDTDIHIPSFLNAHIAVIMALFTHLNNGMTPMMINPESLEQCMHMLALPLKRPEVQRAVDFSIIKGVYKIGLHKFSEYLLTYAHTLSRTNKMLRFRLLADMLFNPPINEARNIILDNLQHVAINELRDTYRAVDENIPLYACMYCKKRYSTEKALSKHNRKGYNSADHRRFRVKEVIHRSQLLFVQQVKWSIAGVFFPAYFELAPAADLPETYFAQVMDKIGVEGRPIGVCEAGRTIRVLDVFGEYLHVVLRGDLGWLRYKIGKRQFVFPACKGKEGFDWDHMHIQEHTTYYRVNDTLPVNVELKIRLMPLPDGEVCGYLKPNQIIECMAVIGDWLQVRYEKEDAAWIMWRTARNSLTTDNTNQLTYHIPATINRPKQIIKQHKSKSGKARAVSKQSDTASLASVEVESSSVIDEGQDDFFNDHVLTYELNGVKTRVNTMRSDCHITREKIELFNEIRYGKNYTQCNPNEDTSTELLILLPKPLQYELITKHKLTPSQVLPSPTVLTQNQIFNYIMNVYSGDSFSNTTGYPYDSSVDFMMDGGSDGSDGGEGSPFNRFGDSSKEDVYNMTDPEDGGFVSQDSAGEEEGDDDGFKAPVSPMGAGMKVRRGGKDMGQSLADYQFSREQNKKR